MHGVHSPAARGAGRPADPGRSHETRPSCTGCIARCAWRRSPGLLPPCADRRHTAAAGPLAAGHGYRPATCSQYPRSAPTSPLTGCMTDTHLRIGLGAQEQLCRQHESSLGHGSRPSRGSRPATNLRRPPLPDGLDLPTGCMTDDRRGDEAAARQMPQSGYPPKSITWRTKRPARIAANASSTSSRPMRRSISRSTGSRPSSDHAAYRGKSIAGSAEP